MGRALRLALAVVSLVTICWRGEAVAQHFGRNKVEYVNFEFKVLATEHFDVHYYASEEETARLAARLAERWYSRFSQVLGHTLGTRQPLILYASQPEFAQTNVVSSFLGEGIGGVTESAKRRIVMPFAPTLAETDQILGHEIAHAFQFDMTRRHRTGLALPLWAVEGMAQYLSLGAADADAATWLRDAVAFKLLPQRRRDAEQKFSPYRYGHAMWAYLAGRFGDRVLADLLKAPGSIEKRLVKVTGVKADQLYDDWRASAREHYGADVLAKAERDVPSPLLRAPRAGRFHLGPAVSPDGHQAVFFSEKDRLSIDLYLADTSSGTITKKLVTTTGSARYESLQAIRSAGSWSPTGDRFVFAAIDQGQAALVMLDLARGGDRKVKFPRLGQIFTPSWSPDGQTIAFAALDGGATDLYLFDVATGALRRLTDDVFADLQPAWSADGRQIAFATDRFTSEPETLTFGSLELAIVEVGDGAIRRVPAIAGASHFNPQWCGDEALYFVADAGGVRNVYRLEIASGRLARITDLLGGAAGLAPTSPALSVARHAPVIAYTVYREGRYELQMRRGAEMLKGVAIESGSAGAATHANLATLPPAARVDAVVEDTLSDGEAEAPPQRLQAKAYAPDLFIEAVGQPSISSGGGPFGTSWRGGGSLLFSDLLGERKVLMYAQVSNRLRETAFGVRYLNRERRWNWGASAELQPSLRRVPRRRVDEDNGQLAITREMQYFDRSQLRFAGHLAYPLNQAQRFEFDGGVRHTRYGETVVSTVRAFPSGRLLSQNMTSGSMRPSATVGEVSAAFVGDTAVWGPTGPIVGGRYRFEIASSAGELAVTRLLLDHRQYFMPVKPYTIATRILHTGYYGADSEDPRLLPAFLGSRQFVRGYGWSSLRCPIAAEGDCSAFDDLLGTRVLVGNLEVRFPIMGVLSRDIRYGLIPAEGFLFADSGLVWSRSPLFTAANAGRHRVTSVGAGVRVAAFFPLELAVVRALDRPARGWSFDISFKTGF